MRQLTPAQEEFFKNSKFKNADGSLKVVYHGTVSEFDTFKNMKKQYDSFNRETGFFFTDNKSEADSHGIRKGGETLEVYLNLKNPLDISINGNFEILDKLVKDCYPNTNWQQEHLCTNKFKEHLNSQGYDSLIIYDIVIAYEPNQIKSIDNLYPTLNDNFKNNKEDYFKATSIKELPSFDDMLDIAEAKAAKQNSGLKFKSKNEIER